MFSFKYTLTRNLYNTTLYYLNSHLLFLGKKEIDWKQVARFSFYGGCYVAPTLFTWIRLSSNMWPTMNLKNGIRKVSIIFHYPLCSIDWVFFRLWLNKFLMVHLQWSAFSSSCQFWRVEEYRLPSKKLLTNFGLRTRYVRYKIISYFHFAKIICIAPQVGVCFWPVMQTINFGFLPEKNRVPFVGACSLLWTIFLSYMKSTDAEKATLLAIEDDKMKKSQ